MLYRTMPSTGDSLSALGFGCMRLPLKKGRIDEPLAEAMIRRAVDAGINYFDTAAPYHGGASEPFLGRALEGRLRERVFVATKLPHWQVRTLRDMDRVLQVQLANLKTDRIDYYLIHNLNGASWTRAEGHGVTEFLDRAKADGRIRHAGFSFHGDKEGFKQIVDAYDWDVCQIQYNYLDEDNQAGTQGLEYAASKGLGVVIMEPLRGGNLARIVPEEVDALWKSAPIARSPVEWALRWVWNRPEVHVVLSGMSREEQLEQNLAIAADARPESLTAEELDLVRRVERAYRGLMQVGCTGCQYCMPCPAGVDIPVCFEQFNNYHMFQSRTAARMVYTLMCGGIVDGRRSMASQCTACGRCVSACPQQLPIPDLMKEVRRDLEGITTRPMIWLAKWYLAFKRFRTNWRS
jgi:hypothetical protein